MKIQINTLATVWTSNVLKSACGFAVAPKPTPPCVTLSPSGPKNNGKIEDENSKTEDDGLSADQLVPDYAAGLVIDL